MILSEVVEKLRGLFPDWDVRDTPYDTKTRTSDTTLLVSEAGGSKDDANLTRGAKSNFDGAQAHHPFWITYAIYGFPKYQQFLQGLHTVPYAEIEGGEFSVVQEADKTVVCGGITITFYGV